MLYEALFTEAVLFSNFSTKRMHLVLIVKFEKLFILQLKTIESKANDSDKMVRKLSIKNAGLSTTVRNLSEEKDRTAQQNWKLLNQKLQLQRLIERLTRLQEN